MIAQSSTTCFSHGSRTVKQNEVPRKYSNIGTNNKQYPRTYGVNERQSQGPHPRNSFKGSYDMDQLCNAFPPLSKYIIRPDHDNNSKNKEQRLLRPTIKFADPEAVRALNTALLVSHYGILPSYSDILPRDALVPPVPGRADYVHHIADILAESSKACNTPNDHSIQGFDVGTGASAIYPLIANSVYGWKMIGSDVNPPSIKSAADIVKDNSLQEVVDVRLQSSNGKIFDSVWRLNEEFDFTMCNPPFYPSLEAFHAENSRKVRGLAKSVANRGRKGSSSKSKESKIIGKVTSNNFGGTSSELWCDGGEVTFVKRMIDESKRYKDRCLWFTSLVSRKENLAKIEQYLRMKNSRQRLNVVAQTHKVSMGAGAKSTSIIMWTYFDEMERQRWASRRGWG